MGITDWLRDLGLGRYESTFVENAIEKDVLAELTEDDLEKLGIPLGDRKRLVKAIRMLAADAPSEDMARGVERRAQGQRHTSSAERRHLTVMICDLVGSTALSTRLDPEDMGAVIDAYHDTCAQITRSYDGYLADFQGDGILAYFGYPRAHGDDAERTVRAALDIVAGVARLDTRAAETLSVRIGIATGLVVIGDLRGKGALRELSLVGEAPNLAARIQALSEPGTVVVAPSTRRLLGNLFRLRDLGLHKVKGIAEPIAVSVVEGEAFSDSRFEAVHTAGVTDLVGREHEIDFLLQRQALAWSGQGQIVLVSGEPGIGKSRLAAALAERSAGQPYTQLRYQCSPYHINSALHPFIVQLERAAGFKAADTSDQRLDKLESLVTTGVSPVKTVAPLFAALLSIPVGERYAPLTLNPAQQRRLTLAALLDHFESLASRQPILFVFEDAHWADATSLELIDLAVERIRQLPVLALFIFRPEFKPPWIGLSNVSTFTLGPLNRSDVENIIVRVTGGRVLPPEVMTQIVGKTDGNPLFVEELTKAVLEAGILIKDRDGYRLGGPLPPLAIPTTLQDSLMARLDRLDSVKEIGQIGAAIGREFSYSLMRALTERDESALQYALEELERAELIFRRGEPPDAVYTFKHALVRDAAYETLLKRRRQVLHSQIARTLEERFADIVASQPEIVAHHFTEGGLVDRAIDYWLKAGNLALGRSANAEAVKHLRRGIELTQSQPPSPTRLRQERDFYLALGPAVSATEGYSAPETLRTFSHARELLGDAGTRTEQMTVLWGIYLAHSMRAEYIAARDVSQRCLTLAAEHQHSGMLALANRFMAQILWTMGAFADARVYIERVLEVCAADQETIKSYRKFGADDHAAALTVLARTLWILGYPEQAASAQEQALVRAQSIGLAFTTALVLDGDALLGAFGADVHRYAAHVTEAITHSNECSLSDYAQRAHFLQGALLAQSGDLKNGIDLMQKAFAAVERTENRNRRTLYLGHIAAAHATLGRPEVGIVLLDEAIQTAGATQERFFEAELHRIRGQTLLMLGRIREAEADLREAVTIAQRQQARWWELRAATALAKHWRDEGKFPEAHSLLNPVYSWFKEGFNTTSLQDAQGLLAELNELSGPQAQVSVR